MLTWAFFTLVTNYINTGWVFLMPGLIHSTLEGIPELALAFVTIYVYSYIGLLLQSVVSNRLLQWHDSHGRLVLFSIQATVEAIMTLGSMYYVYARDQWAFSNKLGVCLWTMVFYMKLHSYVTTHRDIALEVWLRKKDMHSDTQTKIRGIKELNVDLESIRGMEQAQLSKLLALYGVDDESIKSSSLKLLQRLANQIIQQQLVMATAVEQYPRSFKTAAIDFFVFSFSPVLVYQWVFPRNDKFSVRKFIHQCVVSIGLIPIMWLLYEKYILPVVRCAPDANPVLAVAELIIPETLFFILGFFLVFECVFNAWGECTLFADRHFYDDWWNRYLQLYSILHNAHHCYHLVFAEEHFWSQNRLHVCFIMQM